MDISARLQQLEELVARPSRCRCRPSVLVNQDEVLELLHRDAGRAARGDQAGPVDREGPRGAAGQGPAGRRRPSSSGPARSRPVWLRHRRWSGRAQDEAERVLSEAREHGPARCAWRPRTTSTPSWPSSRSRCDKTRGSQARTVGGPGRSGRGGRDKLRGRLAPPPRRSSAPSEDAEEEVEEGR